jgi:hypothetical protein
VLKHYATNRKRQLSALPNVGPHIYYVKISGFTRSSIYMLIYEISRLRVKFCTSMPEDGRKRPKRLSYIVGYRKFVVFEGSTASFQQYNGMNSIRTAACRG